LPAKIGLLAGPQRRDPSPLALLGRGISTRTALESPEGADGSVICRNSWPEIRLHAGIPILAEALPFSRPRSRSAWRTKFLTWGAMPSRSAARAHNFAARPSDRDLQRDFLERHPRHFHFAAAARALGNLHQAVLFQGIRTSSCTFFRSRPVILASS